MQYLDAISKTTELKKQTNKQTKKKHDRMISVRFQGKPFNITVIQVYAPTSNAEEAEVNKIKWVLLGGTGSYW